MTQRLLNPCGPDHWTEPAIPRAMRSRSKYEPHQSASERARRIRQMQPKVATAKPTQAELDAEVDAIIEAEAAR